MGFFIWTSPLSPRPCWLHRLPVRLLKVYHKVYHKMQLETSHFATGAATLVNSTKKKLSDIQRVAPSGELEKTYASSLILAHSLYHVKT